MIRSRRYPEPTLAGLSTGGPAAPAGRHEKRGRYIPCLDPQWNMTPPIASLPPRTATAMHNAANELGVVMLTDGEPDDAS
jgi:hypothetical protein